MRRILLFACLSAGTLLAADEARVREIIAALGADDPAARDAASAELRTLGDQDASGAVERLLEESCRSKDAEVAARSREILGWVRAWERLLLFGGEGTGAVDATTGEYAWRREKPCIAWMGARGRDARAYVHAHDTGLLECVDLRTGEALWKTKTLEWGEAHDGAYWLAFLDEALERISLQTGEVEWRRALVDGWFMEGPSAVLFDSRRLYVRDDEQVIAMDAATGKDLWRTEASLLGLGPDGVYVTVPGIDAREAIVKLDPASGRMLWLRDLPGDGMQFGLDGAGAGLVFVGNETCDLYAMEADTGKVRWELENAAVEVWIEPDGARAWFVDFRFLQVVDLASGKVLAKFPCHGEGAELSVEGNVLCLASCNQESCKVWLAAFDVAGRTPLWEADVLGLEEEPTMHLAYVRIERLPSAIAMVTEAGDVRSIELVDPATGEVRSRRVSK